MTQYPELFAALAASFQPTEVKSRQQANRTFHYITARTAMNRLDDVLGPENWWDEYESRENSVLCRLTIRLPDGTTLTKADAGGYAGMTDQGDDEKSGFSDAFKRACVKFGVGRYLYRDGVPSFVEAEAPPVKMSPIGDKSPRPNEGGYPPPTTGKQLYAWSMDQGTKFEINLFGWLIKWGATKNLPGRLDQWSSEEITAGYTAAINKLNKHLLEVAGKSETDVSDLD